MTWAWSADYLQGHQVWDRYSYRRHLPWTMTVTWAVSSGIVQQVAPSMERIYKCHQQFTRKMLQAFADSFNSVPAVHEFLKNKNHRGFNA